jgi:hypothetical protein
MLENVTQPPSCSLISIFFFFSARIELGTSHVLGKYFITELYTQHCFFFFLVVLGFELRASRLLGALPTPANLSINYR